MKRLCISILAALLLGTFVTADEQGPSEGTMSPNTPPWLKGSTPLHVHLIFAARTGEKVSSRVPYDFDVITDSPQGVDFRVGTEVPIAVTKHKEDERAEWQYRNVGAHIHCTAQTLGNGRYFLSLNFEQSSIHVSDPKDAGVQAQGVPAFDTWSLISGVTMRDGQSLQSALVSNPNTGETAALDITMKVTK